MTSDVSLDALIAEFEDNPVTLRWKQEIEMLAPDYWETRVLCMGERIYTAHFSSQEDAYEWGREFCENRNRI